MHDIIREISGLNEDELKAALKSYSADPEAAAKAVCSGRIKL